MGNFKKTDEVDHWTPLCPCAPVHHTILSQCHTTTLLDNFPPKIIKPTNISLFDLLTTDVLASIDNCCVGLEYHDNFKHVLLRFKYKVNPIIHTIPYKYWTPYNNLAPFKMDSTARLGNQ